MSLPDFGSAYGSRAAELVRSGAFPAFGLDETWTGYRALGDVHFVNGSLESVGLAHLTELEVDAPMINVHALLEAHPETIEVLACRADLVPNPLFAPIPGALADAEEIEHDVVVDGVVYQAFGARTSRGWLLRVDLPDAHVFIEGRGFEPGAACSFRLVEIRDLDPYLRGRRDWLGG